MLTKRPLLFVSLSFVAGMYILSFFDVVNVLLIGLGFAFVTTLLLMRKVRVKNTVILLLCVISLMSGSIRYEISNNIKGRDLYNYIDTTETIEAEIVEGPIITENSVCYIANISSVGNNEVNEKIRLLSYCENDIHPEDLPNIGDVITSNCEIALPKGAMNTGGFDYTKYLKTDGIFFQCEANLNEIQIVGHISRLILHKWQYFRNKCISFFDDTFPEEEGSILKAFITGDKSSITDETAETFSASGLSHVLAVSGLHVSIFITLLVAILKLLSVSKRKQMILSVFGAVFFVFFTGASPSALRAGILGVLALVAKLLFRKADSITSLSFAAALFCLVNPHVIFDASFMLSFSATAGIILFYKNFEEFFSVVYRRFDKESIIYKYLNNFFDSLAVGLSAQIFVIPLLVYLFNGFSVMSVVATMFVTPFLSILLAGGIVFIATSFISSTLAFIPAGLIFFLARLMLLISKFFAGFSFSKIIFGQITPFLILMYALFICVAMFFIKKNKLGYIITLVSFTVLSVAGLIYTYANYNVARVTFINVGQGDCALFKAPGDCDVLFDAGGYFTNERTGEYIIAPYLIKNGVTDVEYVIISHMDYDHTIGLVGLLDTIHVDNLVIPYGQIDAECSDLIINKAKEHNVNILYFTSGDILKVNDNIAITAITPDAKQNMYAEGENDTGIVVRLDYGKTSFLFTGDITSVIEKYLIKTYPDKLCADVLKVAHHGSKNSNCQEFIDTVNPEYAYIPVGNNAYGHPAPETITRLNNVGANVFIGNIHKDVTFYFDSEDIKRIVYKGGK